MHSFFYRHFHFIKFYIGLLFLVPLLFLSGTAQERMSHSTTDELIILWEEGISPEEAARRLSAISPELTLTEHIDNLTICKSISAASADEQLALLNSSPMIRIAEENQTAALCSFEDYNYFEAQWALNNTGSYTYYINQLPIERTSKADIDINLPEAYETLAALDATRSVTVAIIDTGVDITHPALSGHIWRNEGEIPLNGIDDDGNGYIDDVYGWDFFHDDNTVCHYNVSEFGQISALPEDNDNHGTHCAGIIAACQDVFGVAAGIDIRILPLKIHGGVNASGSVASAIKAIKYAENAGADICNLSWGTTLYSEALETVMRESDMLFVVAAGNNGSNNNAIPLYPSSYNLDNMISVTFITQYGNLAADSNYGVSTVDFAAPGQDIYSTIVGGGYHYLSGSSMAAPIVSGTAALLYACGDSLYPQNIKELLIQTLKPLDSLNGLVRYPGIPDAAAALSAADSLVSDTIVPTLRPVTEYLQGTLSIRLQPEDLGGSGIRVISYATGARDLSYFAKGTVGQTITETSLTLGKAGVYTFYICDYAGNEAVCVYTVEDDTTAPSLSASYSLNADDTFAVTVTAADAQSGIKRVRYLKGKHTAEAFLSAGFELLPQNSYAFTAAEEGFYTIYAVDYRGNKTVSVLDIKKMPAEQLFLSTAERTMTVGEHYRLAVLLLPLTNTDSLTFTVADETLLYADADGTLTALAPGTAEVTVTASGGISKTCLFHILPASVTASEAARLP